MAKINVFYKDNADVMISDVKPTISNVLTLEEANRREEKIKKKIRKVEHHANKKADEVQVVVNKAMMQIRDLEKLLYRFHVGQIVLYKRYRKVKILQLLDFKKPTDDRYMGKLLDTDQVAPFAESELMSYDEKDLPEILTEKCRELARRLRELGGDDR